ncbi:hypothetical protein Zm00014a_041623 [Zea mays]|uniref:Uncharacterized protein n=2 Tax=Zea mays TaxID=4577 RepID=B6TF91_MAIZE|nr:hypothetical protein [Zea mays]PWZ58057.1 hypothetical protein Zm00014a_041623 [Zea mays]
MADAPAMASSPPASADDGGPSSPSVAVPRVLPSRLLLDTPPPSSGRTRGPRGGSAAAASRRGGRGGGTRRESTLPAAASNGTGGRRPERDWLAEAVMMIGGPVEDAGLASADILQLAMAKGPMFEWLSYWPEEGYLKEDHPY